MERSRRDATPEGYSRPGGYDCPIARYCRRPHSCTPPVTRFALSDCYSFFSVFPSNRMTTLTTSPVTERPLFIAGAPEANLLRWCFYRVLGVARLIWKRRQRDLISGPLPPNCRYTAALYQNSIRYTKSRCRQ